MGRNKGYAWEKEIADLFLDIGREDPNAPLHRRSRRQPGSGSMESAKGDVATEWDFLQDFGQLLVEAKDRKDGRGDGKSLRVTKDELDKCRIEAESDIRHPVFAVKLKGGAAGPGPFKGDPANCHNQKWFMVPLTTFRYIFEHMRDQYHRIKKLEADLEAAGGAPVADDRTPAQCRACRRELERGYEKVRRVMGA